MPRSVDADPQRTGHGDLPLGEHTSRRALHAPATESRRGPQQDAEGERLGAEGHVGEAVARDDAAERLGDAREFGRRLRPCERPATDTAPPRQPDNADRGAGGLRFLCASARASREHPHSGAGAPQPKMSDQRPNIMRGPRVMLVM